MVVSGMAVGGWIGMVVVGGWCAREKVVVGSRDEGLFDENSWSPSELYVDENVEEDDGDERNNAIGEKFEVQDTGRGLFESGLDAAASGVVDEVEVVDEDDGAVVDAGDENEDASGYLGPCHRAYQRRFQRQPHRHETIHSHQNNHPSRNVVGEVEDKEYTLT